MVSTILNKDFLIICFVNFMMTMGMTMTNALIPKLADSMGAAATLVGLVTSVFALTSVLVMPFSGPAIDSFNRKRILIGAIVLISISFLGYAFSTNIYMLIASRLLQGAGLGFTVLACLTMITDSIPKSKITSGVAYYSVAAAIAQAIGPSTGLYLVRGIGYSMTFLIGFVFVILAAGLAFFINEKPRVKSKFKIGLRNIYAKEAITPAVIMFFLTVVSVTIPSFLILHAEEQGVVEIGFYFTVNAFFLLGSRPLIGWLSERMGTVRVLPVAIIFFALSMVLIGIADNLPMFLLAAVVNAFGFGACQPLIQSLCLKSVCTERRGAASATSYYGTGLGFLAGPILAGQLIEINGYAMMFCLMALILFIPLMLCYRYRNRLNEIDLI